MATAQHLVTRTLVVGAAAALLGSCAQPLQPDLKATAPRLDGFGSLPSAAAISSASPAARQRFADASLQAYAFNEAEAVRMFKAALAADPACAMCAWGVAWQLGPNINAPQRGDMRQAERYADLALRNAALAPDLSARERALIEAMALRVGHASTARETAPLRAAVCSSSGGDPDARRDPLEQAYADRLYQLLQRWPDDADLLSLWAEAEMVATSGDWFDDKTGRYAARLGEVADRLERALQAQPAHTGLNHYLIHVTDTRAQAHRAVAAADRLGALAPKAPHLVHMPAHTYAHVGRYADATRVNQQAVALDVELADLQKAQGFSVSKDWRNHNQHFQWFGALMEGRGDLALAAARELATRNAARKSPYADYLRALPALTLLRLERWDALLAEPPPVDQSGLGRVLHGHARGIAQLRRQDLPAALKTLAEAAEANAQVARGHAEEKGFDAWLRKTGDGAIARLLGEIALTQGQPEAALAQLQQAAEAMRESDENEPPLMAAGAGVMLADLQLRSAQPAQAEATLRDDLKAWPNSGWALRGLLRAAQAQGQAAAAADWGRQLAAAWPLADAALKDAR